MGPVRTASTPIESVYKSGYVRGFRHFIALASLWLGIAQSELILPVTSAVEFSTTATATGTASATLVPFNLDITANDDFEENIEKSLTSVWESKVSVYDDGDQFVSFVSMQWPSGEGPGAPPVGDKKQWNTCVIAIPDLFDQLGLKGPENGSWVDTIESACWDTLGYIVFSSWKPLAHSSRPFTTASAAYACEQWKSLPLSPLCFANVSQELPEVKVYPRLNPTNGEPFILAVDKYGAGDVFKAAAYKRAISRAWPLLVVEAEEETPVWTTSTWPSAGIPVSPKSPLSSYLKGWTSYGGPFGATSKAILGSLFSDGIALMDGSDFDDFTYDTDIMLFTYDADTMFNKTAAGNCGLVFRVSDPSDSGYRGYYAALDVEKKKISLSVVDNDSKEIGSADFSVKNGGKWHMRVSAQADSISVYVDDMKTAKITVKDKTFTKGAAGVRIAHVEFMLDNMEVTAVSQTASAPKPDGSSAKSLGTRWAAQPLSILISIFFLLI
ncbi:hypothetical protein PWT90_05091 [Aphanocladium album]|nr:hypothetical protein PWT90_05091 [Aphanocladium album]